MIADRILDFADEHIMPWMAVGLMVLCVGMLLGLPVLIYCAIKSDNSPTISLRKADWACTQSQTIPITTYVMSGKVMVPITTYMHQCQQWNRQ